ncbi:hypothetical protein [Pelagicoccus mobilis]|uniref:Inositol monophosphatase n=1 Tax=Pelagicoccus mobilis TaxID=415221 RepID=A0A934S0B5_9BACT|nr:hypothetical protein [Pelagicoccus mobilis]MBK1878206.1 hypothetical protein [Pelagicoccus mobilis]
MEALSAVAAETKADIIYQIDKVSEELILDWLANNWPKQYPVRLIMEGIDDATRLTFPADTPPQRLACQLIVDPIDGTRGLMYDKRSAWALVGLAQTPSAHTNAPTLEDISVAVMTELPTSKQFKSEQLAATRSPSGETTFSRISKNLLTGETQDLPASPSRATNLKHGFASVAKFFPQAKAALAAFEEELYAHLTPEEERQDALIFDDQYISTGGQLYELIAGHDRLAIDIRPLAFQKLGLPLALSCHPYDLCTALVARAAGVIVTQPHSKKLDIPFDTTTPVSWIAYANQTLANEIHPVVETLIQKHFS